MLATTVVSFIFKLKKPIHVHQVPIYTNHGVGLAKQWWELSVLSRLPHLQFPEFLKVPPLCTTTKESSLGLCL